MKPLVAIVDYGMGNLRSVQKALEQAGADAQVTHSPELLRKARGVVLPGVGAFGEAVKRLKTEHLWNSLKDALASGKPFLGICLGYQLLFEKSEESPGIKGLGLFKGSVKRFRFPKGSAHKVPHMGWNTLNTTGRERTPCLKGVRPGDYYYFVHSFIPEPKDRSLSVTQTTYGRSFVSSIARGALFACQFHPEKSGRQGLRILKNFVLQVNAC